MLFFTAQDKLTIMKRVFKILIFVLVLGITAVNASCSDDEKDPPKITFPSNGSQYEVKVGETTDFSFLVVAEGGYASHLLESTGNKGLIAGDNSTPGAGTKEFTISGRYLAGNVAGPDGIKLTVVDNEGAESSAIINVDILN